MITLTDKNDNAPRFLLPYYTVSILEGPCDSNKPLATITAVDDDDDQGSITFVINTGGNPNSRFLLRDENKNSTKLYCSGNINRETTSDLKVTIKATDNPTTKPTGNPPPRLSSTVNVFVHVEDRDETPESSAEMRVIVNAVDGKFPGGVIAKTYFKDNDGDGDSTMTYTLTGMVYTSVF